jgi:hypothetical protein
MKDTLARVRRSKSGEKISSSVGVDWEENLMLGEDMAEEEERCLSSPSAIDSKAPWKD